MHCAVSFPKLDRVYWLPYTVTYGRKAVVGRYGVEEPRALELAKRASVLGAQLPTDKPTSGDSTSAA